MSRQTLGLLLIWLGASFHAAGRACAEEMDVLLSRLSQGACAATRGEGALVLRLDQAQALRTDEAAFGQLVTQLGSVVAPVELAPVVTSGARGFDVALETSVAEIEQDASYWQRGTRGSHAPETCDGRNDDVRSVLVTNRLRFRKGLPLGISLGASVGKVQASGMYLVGVDVTMALLEDVWHSRLPDAALRAALTRLVGTRELTLYVATLDLVLSKRWVIANRVEVSPYVGGGAMWTHAAAGLVDLTPNIDAFACQEGMDSICNAAGAGASADDLGHDVYFDTLSLVRSRVFAGLWVRYGYVALASSVTSDLLRPQLGPRAGGDMPRQWTVSVAPVLSF